MVDYVADWLYEKYSGNEGEAEGDGICSGFRQFLQQECDEFDLIYPFRKDVGEAIEFVEEAIKSAVSYMDDVANAVRRLHEHLDDYGYDVEDVL
jgi:hypothetical protein